METIKLKSEALELIYQDTEIHFLFSDDENVLVNATEMAKVFGKRTEDFLKTQSTKSFIDAIEFPPVGVNSEIIHPLNRGQIIQNRGRNGIYFERRLALKFAAWLDVNFEVWIFTKLDEILFGKAKQVATKISDEEKKKLKIATLMEKVKKVNNSDMNELLFELEELKKITNEKKKAMRQFSNQYKMF
jgi:hypothetical protein